MKLHTCVARSAKSCLWQAVVLVDRVPKVTNLEDGPTVMGFKQNVLQLDVPICHTHSALQKALVPTYVLVLLNQHKVQKLHHISVEPELIVRLVLPVHVVNGEHQLLKQPSRAALAQTMTAVDQPAPQRRSLQKPSCRDRNGTVDNGACLAHRSRSSPPAYSMAMAKYLSVKKHSLNSIICGCVSMEWLIISRSTFLSILLRSRAINFMAIS